MIIVSLNSEDMKKVAEVRKLCDEEVLTNPNLNGAVILVEAGDFTCIEGIDDEYTGAQLFADVVNVLNGEVES